VIGITTSSGYGHTIGKNICYGYLPTHMREVADGYEIESYNTIYPAQLETNRQLYDPERKKIFA
jgi:glycine cleavage system aminomethyltransferase T